MNLEMNIPSAEEARKKIDQGFFKKFRKYLTSTFPKFNTLTMKKTKILTNIFARTNDGVYPDSVCSLIWHGFFIIVLLPFTWWTYFAEKNVNQSERFILGISAFCIYSLLFCFGFPWLGERPDFKIYHVLTVPIYGALTLAGLFYGGQVIYFLFESFANFAVKIREKHGNKFCKKIDWKENDD
jgi:hypothetical protein